MSADERQVLLTAVWMFMRHGQPARARAVCEALVEEEPRDGVAAVALADREPLLREFLKAAKALDKWVLIASHDALSPETESLFNVMVIGDGRT